MRQPFSYHVYYLTMRLENKVTLITGSDSGIGQATAVEFAREGADIVITYRKDKTGAEKTLSGVKAAGRKGIIVQVDVGDEQQVERMFDQALQEFGTVDILMNNAAINAAGIKLGDMSTERWREVMRVNLDGYFFCTRRFIRIRKEKGGGGKILNVTSVHEEIPMVGAADYDATKGAVRNLTRTLALELAEDGITVNNIAPGMVLTPMNQDALDDEESRKKQTANIPLKRAATPGEIARLAVFLASDEADYVTGSSYVMDGGLMQSMGQGA